MENKYFTELTRRLNEDGISTGTPDGGKLPIFLEGQEVGIVVPGGGLRVRKESLDESGHFDFDPNLADHVDFQGYGERRVREENGVFTEYGYIAYRGITTLVEDILESSRVLEQGQQMGGM